MALNPQPKALFFDVFGTCVDWRKTVTNTLWNAARQALNSPTSSIASRIRIVATDMRFMILADSPKDCIADALYKEWRTSYLKFTKSIAQDPNKQFKTVDEHHLEALHDILTHRGLIMPREDSTPDMLVHDGSLWDEPALQELNLVWHRLEPWPDTCKGIEELNRKFYTCTLSNGNISLLEEMVEHGKMGFTHIYSAEMFKSYKPSPKVYLGAAEKMGIKPEECCMVAAHLNDLKAAKSNGFSTVYVERPQEERSPELKDEEGIIDVWVKEGEEGFVTAAERLGIDVQR